MNWKSKIAEIKATGWNEVRIAGFCGCTQSTINSIATGNTKDPRHSLGDKLLNLHRLRTRAKRRNAPKAS